MLGTVQSLALTPDHSRVLVKIATTRQAEPLLTDRRIFWVVKPRLFAGNVSGLRRWFLAPMSACCRRQTRGSNSSSSGREDPPVLEANVPGTTFLLKASRMARYRSARRCIRDIAVGEVLGWDIGDMAASVTIHAFVRDAVRQVRAR